MAEQSRAITTTDRGQRVDSRSSGLYVVNMSIVIRNCKFTDNGPVRGEARPPFFRARPARRDFARYFSRLVCRTCYLPIVIGPEFSWSAQWDLIDQPRKTNLVRKHQWPP